MHLNGWERNQGDIDLDWHHLVGTYDDNQLISWYYDGDFIGSEARTLYTQDNVRLGMRAHSDQLWRGWVDDAHIYNYAMTEEEIATYYTEIVLDAMIQIGGYPQMDLGENGMVDLEDLVLFLSEYLNSNEVTE
jgi:hypothetical protein